MAKKGKPMPIGLQRHIIKKILLKRGNTGPRKTVDGQLDYDNVSPDHDTSALDIEAILDHIRSDYFLDENISFLEGEGYLLSGTEEEMGDSLEKKFLHEQEELEREKEDRLRDRLWKFYDCKRKKPKQPINK
ncbi:MAG: hypothetical protein KAU84_01505 [Thermoplasmatales archaeon]|nr:hypothetical protein [Thermoplasmatales archaeon]